MLKGYKENLVKTKKMEAERKGDMMRNAAEQELSKKEKQKLRMRKKLEANKQKKRMEELAKKQVNDIQLEEDDLDENTTNVTKLSKNQKRKNKRGNYKESLVNSSNNLRQVDKELEKKEKLAKAEIDRIRNNEQVINERKNNASTIQDKLNRIEELYKKMNG